MPVSRPRSSFSYGLSFWLSATVLGCARVPDLQPIANSSGPDPHHPGSISINEVVKRVKCEIRDSIAERLGPNYKWLSKWTISADLTLAVNDVSQISPGAVLTNPLPLGNIPGRVTNFSQSFSLGIGGEVSTTAVRTEIVSFSMSVKEIEKEFFRANGKLNPAAANLYHHCQPYGDIPIDLTGSLGLKEWVDSALGPVTERVGPASEDTLLRVGSHKAPKGPSATGGAGGSTQSLKANSQELSAKIEDFRKAGVETSVQQLLDNLEHIEKDLDDYSSLVEEIEKVQFTIRSDQWKLTQPGADMNALKADIKNQNETLADLIKRNQKAITAKATQILNEINAVLPALQAQCDCTQPPDAGKQPSAQDQNFAAMLKCLKTIQTNLKGSVIAPPSDPPIDAISHQVQFVLMLNASANPTWTLLKFKGPSPASGSFASATGTNTHTLTIVMGEPSSPAAANARSSLTFGAAVASQLPQAAPSTPGFF
jgi:hypothetical protein